MPSVDPNSTDVCHPAWLCYAKVQTKGFVHARLRLSWVLVLIDIPPEAGQPTACLKLTVQLRLYSNSLSSCLRCPNAEVMGLCYHTLALNVQYYKQEN